MGVLVRTDKKIMFLEYYHNFKFSNTYFETNEIAISNSSSLYFSTNPLYDGDNTHAAASDCVCNAVVFSTFITIFKEFYSTHLNYRIERTRIIQSDFLVSNFRESFTNCSVLQHANFWYIFSMGIHF